MRQASATTGDEIALCVLRAFDKLPKKRRPLHRTDGSREWVPLSGIVLAIDKEPLLCASLGTGMKCLPSSKVPRAQGTVLHDWHAEILAIRSFNRFLLQECAALEKSGRPSQYVRKRRRDETSDVSHQPFAINDKVSIYMYCSECPCGDASMELIMQGQDDPTPWDTPTFLDGANFIDNPMKGRGYFSELGVVRRKPEARPDAPVALSKSCTDKLALYQCTSILSSLVSLLISPQEAYIKALVLPHSQYVPVATERAFSPVGRMASVSPEVINSWPSGFSFQPFEIATTNVEFEWSRRGGAPGQSMTASNVSALYTPYFEETLIGGVLQGRKQLDPLGASAISRKSMWQAVAALVAALSSPILMAVVMSKTYAELKNNPIMSGRQAVKADVCKTALIGWVKNEDDNQFGLQQRGSEDN